MKRNIDLTQNRDFQRKNDRQMLFPYQRLSSLYRLIMKDKIKEDIPKDKWGIYQGNMMDRFSKKMSKDYNLGLTCERCGKKLFPYYKLSLCNKCDLEISLPTFERAI